MKPLRKRRMMMNVNKMRAASIKNTMQMKAAMNGEG